MILIPVRYNACRRIVKPHIMPHEGGVVVDDTTLDKPYARQMDLMSRHWSGKHPLVWTVGQGTVFLEFQRIHGQLSRFETKQEIVGEPIRPYLAAPTVTLPSTA